MVSGVFALGGGQRMELDALQFHLGDQMTLAWKRYCVRDQRYESNTPTRFAGVSTMPAFKLPRLSAQIFWNFGCAAI
jgi:hypothetical protein